jgi:hypothetical protein
MALVSTILSVGLGAYQAVMGAQARQEAKRKMNQKIFQDLSKSATEGLSPSMKLLEDQINIVRAQTSQMGEIAAQQGAAGAQGALGNVTMKSLDAQQKIFGLMRDRQYQYDLLGVQDAQQRRAMQEQRDLGEMQSLAQQYTAGSQTMLSGIAGGVASVGVLEGLLDKKDPLSKEEAARILAGINRNQSQFADNTIGGYNDKDYPDGF